MLAACRGRNSRESSENPEEKTSMQTETMGTIIRQRSGIDIFMKLPQKEGGAARALLQFLLSFGPILLYSSSGRSLKCRIGAQQRKTSCLLVLRSSVSLTGAIVFSANGLCARPRRSHFHSRKMPKIQPRQNCEALRHILVFVD